MELTWYNLFLKSHISYILEEKKYIFILAIITSKIVISLPKDTSGLEIYVLKHLIIIFSGNFGHTFVTIRKFQKLV